MRITKQLKQNYSQKKHYISLCPIIRGMTFQDSQISQICNKARMQGNFWSVIPNIYSSPANDLATLNARTIYTCIKQHEILSTIQDIPDKQKLDT